jgi:hypothetical protein
MKSRTYLAIVIILLFLVIAAVFFSGVWDSSTGSGNGM